MNERYKKIMMAAVPMAVTVGMLFTSLHMQETEAAKAAVVLETTKIEEQKEIQIYGGIGATLAAIEEGSMAETAEAQEHSEYSDFAIANVTNYVNVRTEPNTESEIVGKMYDNSVAQILSRVGEGENEWFQVISGSVEGYIKAEYFIYGDDAAAVIDDYVTRNVVVKADRLNVREHADISSSRIGYMDYAEKAKLLEYGEEWSKILYAGEREGYVASQYITVEEEFVYAKSIAEELRELEAQRLLAQRVYESEDLAPENTAIRITPPVDYANVSELRTAIVNYAMQYLGNRYVSGGRSLETGTDCSGFTCYTYAVFGYSLSRTPQGQWGSNGRQITMDQIQPGDIVCYSSSGGRCTHVGLYIGNGQIIHAANSRKGVIISDVYYDNTFIGIKNVID